MDDIKLVIAHLAKMALKSAMPALQHTNKRNHSNVKSWPHHLDALLRRQLHTRHVGVDPVRLAIGPRRVNGRQVTKISQLRRAQGFLRDEVSQPRVGFVRLPEAIHQFWRKGRGARKDDRGIRIVFLACIAIDEQQLLGLDLVEFLELADVPHGIVMSGLDVLDASNSPDWCVGIDLQDDIANARAHVCEYVGAVKLDVVQHRAHTGRGDGAVRVCDRVRLQGHENLLLRAPVRGFKVAAKDLHQASIVAQLGARGLDPTLQTSCTKAQRQERDRRAPAHSCE
mmetsp:Transcript_129438/g.414898  ORF Transcript_129438/g.414898 Transcript_129438/m.414898 type:complete len:283 (+) Transcript_129438:121-969(+)